MTFKLEPMEKVIIILGVILFLKVMLGILFILLKKDALLAKRNKIWTTFEILLPVLLLMGTAFGAYKAKEKLFASSSGTDKTKVHDPFKGYVKYWNLTLCPQSIPIVLSTHDSDYVKSKEIKESQHEFQVEASEEKMKKDVIKQIDECVDNGKGQKEEKIKIGVSIKERSGTSISYTLMVPVNKMSVASDDWNDFTEEMYQKDFFAFTTLQNRVDKDLMKSAFEFNVEDNDWEFNSLHGIVQLQGYKTMLFSLPLLFGVCLLLTVVNITRNVVTEKASVKPYLSAMGLPGWMFYCEHLVASSIKTIVIVPLSLSLWIYVLDDVNPVVFLFGTLIYALGANSFALLFSAFFKTSKRATEVTVVFWLLLCVLPHIGEAEGIITVLYSVNINHAFHYYFDAVVVNILRSKEVTIGTLFSSEETRHYSCGVYLLMMVFDFIWMYAAAVLLDHYKNKIDSIGWMNFFKTIGRSKAGKGSDDLENRDVILKHCAQKEHVREKATADIDLKKLVKIYPTGEKAVNGLTLRAIRGQVSILLGHNGCGKSTTFSMISGINLPTSGSITIGGVNALKNRSKARSLIGMCPQYNPIYEKLTVMEHLALVNALKGGNDAEGKREAIQLLKDIGLSAKKNDLAGNLSGGMKRKLCVCMAMINKSKVVLLDEPTAGMDPGARKDVQKMLEKEKKKRTILLTTHYMDEAERLGDWIFVMSHGKMAASGTSAFLKKRLGSGFLLTIVLENEGKKKEIYKLVEIVCETYIKDVEVKDVRGQMIEFNIPEKAKSMLLGLLQALEAIKYKKFSSPCLSSVPEKARNSLKKVKIATLGLALNSLEQVFIKIGEECKKIVDKGKDVDHKNQKAESYQKLMQMKGDKRRKGTDLKISQFSGLIRKRFRYSLRNYDQYMNQFIIPILLLVLYCNHARKGIKDTIEDELIEMTLDNFPKSIVYVIGSDSRIEDYLKKFKHLTVKTTSETDTLKLVRKHYYRTPRLGFVVEYKDKKLKIHYNPEAFKAKMILTNVLANLLLIVNDKSGKKVTTNVQYLSSDDEKQSAKLMTAFITSIVITFLLSMITSPFVVFLIEERMAKYSHQQLLTGISQVIFWAASVVYDLIFFLVLSAIIIGITFCFDLFRGDNLLPVALLFMLYSYSIIPVIYTASSLVDGPSKASILLIIYQVVLGLISTGILAFIEYISKSSLEIARLIAYSIVPTSGFCIGLVKTLIGASKDQPIYRYSELMSWDGMMSEVVYLSITGTISLMVFLLIQVRRVRRQIFKQFHSKQRVKPRADNHIKPCPAVFKEEKISRKPDMQKTAVVLIRDLVRQFGTYRAVNGICLTVKKNECFGMLGTNGAGKTTTFDILTGLRFPSGGAAFVDGRNVSRRTNIGYCPQFDAILQEFTGKEVLELMAQLHGYPQVEKITEHVLNCVGMTEHAHKRVRFCSGGQKRKISVGIALLSRSHCVILDEPTAGIDPDARRDIWETLVWLREKSGCSIVLTSHSMEECEALCSRIAILKKGEVIALGTSQDLKSQYGYSYSLTLVMNTIKDRKRFCQEVKKRIKRSILRTASSNKTLSLNWEIPKKKSDKWSSKFSAVQSLAHDLKAKDFMLAESSLEDTFILLTSD